MPIIRLFALLHSDTTRENIKNRLRSRISHLTHSNLGGVKQSDAKHVGISINYDETKVPKVLALSRANKAIIGGAVPNHLISFEEMSKEEVKAVLDPKSDVVRADKSKACVVSVQDPTRGRSPFIHLVIQP